MIPIENSLVGRIADIHHLLPSSGLHIVGEYFLPIRFQLMAPKGATLDGLKTVESQIPALGQCRRIIRRLGLTARTAADTAGAARMVAESRPDALGAGDPARRRNLRASTSSPRTSRTPRTTPRASCALARGRRRPAERRGDHHHLHLPRAQHAGRALQGAGGFATNGINITKAGELPARRPVLRLAVLRDVEGHPGRARPQVRARGTRLLQPRGPHPRRLSGEPLPREDPRARCGQGAPAGGVRSGRRSAAQYPLRGRAERSEAEGVVFFPSGSLCRFRTILDNNAFDGHPQGRPLPALRATFP